MTTIFVCGKCGRSTTSLDDNSRWLIKPNKKRKGQMIIRCPDCTTNYALRLAGKHKKDKR